MTNPSFDANDPKPFNDRGAVYLHTVYMTKVIPGVGVEAYNRHYTFLGSLADGWLKRLKANGAAQTDTWEAYTGGRSEQAGYAQWWEYKAPRSLLFSDTQLAAAYAKLIKAKQDLGPDLGGYHAVDLMMDNFDWLNNTAHAHQLLLQVDKTYGCVLGDPSDPPLTEQLEAARIKRQNTSRDADPETYAKWTRIIDRLTNLLYHGLDTKAIDPLTLLDAAKGEDEV